MPDGQSIFTAGGYAGDDAISRVGKLTMTSAMRTAELVFDMPCGSGAVRMYLPANLSAAQRAEMFDQLAAIERGKACGS